jgi:diguanylate cyclase (GGDEF)-like protein
MMSQAVLDTLPFGVLLTDADLVVVQVNLWLADRLSMPAAALIARPLAAAFPELAERSLLAAFDLARNDGRTVRLPASLYTYFLKLSSQTGDKQADMPQSATIAPLFVDGRVVGTLTLIEDETQRLLNERQLQRQIDKMTALHEVDHALATLDLDACLQTIAERSRILFGGQNSALLMRRDGQLAVVAATGYEQPVLGKAIGEGEGITGWVVNHQTAVLAPDVSRDPRYFELDSRTRSEMAAPLMLRDVCIGVINVESYNLDAFDADDMDTMEWLATRAAAAIHNAQLHTAEREQRTLADTLRNIGLTLSTELNPDAILDTLLDHVARVVPYDSASVLMLDQRTGRVRIARERGYDRFGVTDSIPRFEVPMADFANLVHMAEHLQPLVIGRTRDDAAWVVTTMSRHIESWAGAPIIARGQLLGFLSLDNVVPGFYSQELAERLAVFAAQAGLALENARLYAEQQKLATTDGLTGLANRRFFDIELARELQRADRHKRPTSLIMIDLDDFKSYNDRYGHPAGDDLLRSIAVMLGQYVRTLDTAARYGGEEFVLILPETQADAACGAAERLRELVAQLPLTPESAATRVTISLGVAVAPIHGMTPPELVKAADQALYAAKRAGKNRSCLYEIAPAPGLVFRPELGGLA